MNHHQGDNKPSLPSIKDLIEGGPGLIDYSPTTTANKYSHRRHASEHILSIHHQQRYEQPIPPIPTSSSITTHSLPFDMQSLSLDKRKIVPKTSSDTTTATAMTHPLTTSSSTLNNSSRHRTHSRSFSDFTHPYPRQQLNTIDDAPSSPPTEQEGSVSPIMDDEDIEEKIFQTTIGGKYVCPYCEKGFTRPSSLRTHTYSHTGEKPFQCTEPGCGRKFSVQSNLRRHLRIHRANKSNNTLFITNNIK